MDCAPDVLAAFLRALDCDAREVAAGEWGFELEAGGWPLHVGVAVRGDFVRAQALVVGAGRLDPHQLLYWNRQAPLVCFAENGAGEVFVCGEVPVDGLSAQTLDSFLGLLVAAAARARELT
jgi:hypothetical protein